VRYWLNRSGAVADETSGDRVGVLPLFDDAQGCEKFAQRVLRFGAGRSGARADEEADEVLFVLEGSGTASVGEATVPLRPGVGLFVRRAVEWSVETESGLELLSVLVHDPEPTASEHAAVDLAGEERRSATAARQFVIGVSAENGCSSVTQFIGFVPPGRAPDHFHRYDEVIYVLDGEGMLHVGGEDAPLGAGACVHLPARLVHCLENTGESELRLLGVFRPSGSPAEAYYPDGTPAVHTDD